MVWRKGRLCGGVGRRAFADLICVDPDAGTITRGKGLRAETHPLDNVTIQLEETQLVLSRGMFGWPRCRASKPIVHIVGAGWRWDIPVGVPLPRVPALVGDYARWKVHGERG